MWFKIENCSVSNSNEVCKIWRKNQYPPFPRKREREKERTRIQQGSLSVTSTFYNDNG